ncbi:hypothetical protein CDL12_24310 [Handroanthus impetiginosus]|uniref:Uncharacterized protein n=1 Tax=Handroanthus impetiginosus TaxID=429701 RepID=A0A2G9GD09_9LAMI|nr:hypothetical protein CDL12_24310 [Handroanthus impetiginosus]
MDIDLMCSLGGCMATTLKLNSSFNLEFSSKPHNLLLFFGLLFMILVALVNSSSSEDFSKPSSDMASVLPSHHQTTAKTVEFHPRKRGNPRSKGKDPRFGASDHEVPSGPNPISNR